MSGGNLEAGMKSGVEGFKSGCGTGAVTGTVQAYRYASQHGYDSWTGRPKESYTIGHLQDRVDIIAKDLKSETISPEWRKQYDRHTIP